MSENINDVRNELRKEIKGAGMELYAQGFADSAEGIRKAVEAIAIKLGDTGHGPGLRLALYAVTEASNEAKKVADSLD